MSSSTLNKLSDDDPDVGHQLDSDSVSSRSFQGLSDHEPDDESPPLDDDARGNLGTPPRGSDNGLPPDPNDTSPLARYLSASGCRRSTQQMMEVFRIAGLDGKPQYRLQPIHQRARGSHHSASTTHSTSPGPFQPLSRLPALAQPSQYLRPSSSSSLATATNNGNAGDHSRHFMPVNTSPRRRAGPVSSYSFMPDRVGGRHDGHSAPGMWPHHGGLSRCDCQDPESQKGAAFPIQGISGWSSTNHSTRLKSLVFVSIGHEPSHLTDRPAKRDKSLSCRDKPDWQK